MIPSGNEWVNQAKVDEPIHRLLIQSFNQAAIKSAVDWSCKLSVN